MKHKGSLKQLLADAGTKPEIRQRPSFGTVWLLSQVARELGITKALGDKLQGKLSLWQVLARTISQGSRLSAVRLAGSHALAETSRLDGCYCLITDLPAEQADKISPSYRRFARQQSFFAALLRAAGISLPHCSRTPRGVYTQKPNCPGIEKARKNKETTTLVVCGY